MAVKKAKTIEHEGCLVKLIHQDRVDRARTEAIDSSTLNRMSGFFKALGDYNRLRLIMALSGGEMCVCDLAAFLEVSDSAVSHQLRRLKEQELVRIRRDGQILYYSLNDDHVERLLSDALEHINE